MARKSRKFSGVNPDFLAKERASLKRTCRKTILFNEREIKAINEYCQRFKVESRSALIRKSVMETVLKGLNENLPTLFE